ncbi:muconolactone Delta-isomerase family protein [Aminiphilus sp.]|jgi:muconolactone delta-isomerase|uniref:muconolactone Delta-isomerase family protein n=1 Tax=Aminiphilus sp. TaxID=1872488 RepID=UPI00262E9F52|nr:muconolactone Delta-isomerase family protein [Aminiphilus sp.]
MRILALARDVPGTHPEAFAPHLDAEALRAWELHQAGLLREIHFRASRRDAVLLLECADEAEARDALASLPLVKEGLITFEVIPLVPYDGFARLFR